MKKIKTLISLPEKDLNLLDKVAKQNNVSKSAVIMFLIRQFLTEKTNFCFKEEE